MMSLVTVQRDLKLFLAKLLAFGVLARRADVLRPSAANVMRVLMILLACMASASLLWAADHPKTIIDLQPFRKASSIRIKGAGGKEGLATLINLNPAINSWYLLRLDWGGGAPEEIYHLQNAKPLTQTLLLEETNPNGVIIAHGKERFVCDLWAANGRESLKDARKSGVDL